mmetsp:Transcript_39629/g.110194  ORF Transcript_39629/g.110194 Transcript_39629/m.110194 type:complete len:221 (-) Transcript_39629:1469-2131(-)
MQPAEGAVLVVDLADHEEVVLSERCRVVARLRGEISGEVRRGVGPCGDAEAVDVGVRDPVLDEVGVDLLEDRVERVELKVLGAEVVRPHLPRLELLVPDHAPPRGEVLPPRPVHLPRPAAREEGLVPEVVRQRVPPAERAPVLLAQQLPAAGVPIGVLVSVDARGDLVDDLGANLGLVPQVLAAGVVDLHVKYHADAEDVRVRHQLPQQGGRAETSVDVH